MQHSYPFAQVLTKKFFLVAFFFAPLLLTAQNDDPNTTDLLENYFRDNEFASESDAQQFLENLEQFRDQPLDINRVSRNDLVSLHLLSEIQIDDFLAYRAQFGAFLSIYELQAIPGWDLEDIRRILPYVRANSSLQTRNVKLLHGFYKGENELLLRWGRPVPPNYSSFGAASQVEGAPNAVALRYRHTFDNRLRFGFTAESDPGEAIFRKSNPQGFDFYSFHLFAKDINEHLKVVALGDYSARFGQGLLLQTGFSPGKSAETVSVVRGGRKINSYAAFGETFFFRGAAATFALNKHIEITALYSNRHRDGNVLTPDTIDQEYADLVFSSLQTSGYHRTSSEIQDEKSIHEQVGGASVSYLWNNAQITANGLYVLYDKPWNPATAAYRRFVFSGKSLAGTSLDYHWRWRNLFLFGETARSDNGAVATVNGLLLAAHRNVTLSAVQRSYPKDYQAIYAAPFGETSGGNNEKGLFIGADIRWTRRWQLNFYADVWRHPWLRFDAGAPSAGRDYLARVLWQKGKTFSAYLLYKTETKEHDGPEGAPGLVPGRLDRLRLHVVSKVSSALELRSRLEWSVYRLEGQQPASGYLAFEEAVFKAPGSPVRGSVRFSVFDTRNYDARIYAFENDLFAAVSIPAFSGKGARYYFNLQWNVSRNFRLEARVEETNILRAVTSTGNTGKERYFKLQARIKW